MFEKNPTQSEQLPLNFAKKMTFVMVRKSSFINIVRTKICVVKHKSLIYHYFKRQLFPCIRF